MFRWCAASVSYTHLDVYKRQFQKNQTMEENAKRILAFKENLEKQL